jgi:hypothetical protein
MAVKKKTAKTATRKPAAKKKAAKKKAAKKTPRKWSGKVTKESDALDLKSRVFTYKDPAKIARSLKRSAEKSTRKKGTPFQSAMSMLNFYINRAGKTLSKTEKQPLEKAKTELRKLFHKDKPA